jgi:hypothetical protein
MVDTTFVQFKVMFGFTKPPDQFVRETLKLATHEFAAEGAVVKETLTPGCGLLTVNEKPVIPVVLAGKSPLMFTVVVVSAVPEHWVSRLPITQLLGAPGYRGALLAAIARSTGTPPTVVGADASHDHTAGQEVDPTPEQTPESTTATATVPTVASKLMVIAGSAGTLTQDERTTLNTAFHPFSAEGTCETLTTTPPVGLDTTKPKLLMLWVPAGNCDAILTVVCDVWLPAQVRLNSPTKQAGAAPGYSKASPETIAAVRLMPLSTAGADWVQLQLTEQFAEFVPDKIPVS